MAAPSGAAQARRPMPTWCLRFESFKDEMGLRGRAKHRNPIRAELRDRPHERSARARGGSFEAVARRRTGRQARKATATPVGPAAGFGFCEIQDGFPPTKRGDRRNIEDRTARARCGQGARRAVDLGFGCRPEFIQSRTALTKKIRSCHFHPVDELEPLHEGGCGSTKNGLPFARTGRTTRADQRLTCPRGGKKLGWVSIARPSAR